MLAAPANDLLSLTPPDSCNPSLPGVALCTSGNCCPYIKVFVTLFTFLWVSVGAPESDLVEFLLTALL